MVSMQDPEHIHTCTGDHDAGYHWCAECKRWWWQRPKEGKK